MSRYVSPIDDRVRPPVVSAPRLASVRGATIGLLDIAKPRSREFLDRMEALLREDHGVGEVLRIRKSTPTRPAPPEVLAEAQRCGAVLVALAD